MCLPRPPLPPYKSLPFFDGLNWKRFLSEQKGDEEATVTPPTRGFIVAECWGAFVPLMCGEKCLIIFITLLLMSRGSIVLTRIGFPFWCVAYHHPKLLTIMSLNLQLLYLLSLSICVLLKVFFGVLFNVDVVFFARVPGTTYSNGVFRCLRNFVRHRLFGESSKQLSVVL